ncbi:MAG: glutaminyl-peptide cyclotransferase, partial [Sediminibacterium sp.]
LLMGLGLQTFTGIAAPAQINYTIISQFPHDTSSFTEGLEMHNGKLYESGGEYLSSRIQYGDYKTGIVEKMHKMGTDKIFGEGLTILNGKIYQLTYQTHIVYVYDINNIEKPIKTFPWPQEGWGMTNNGTDLIITTKEHNLYFVDPETFKVKNTLAVVDDKGPIPEINELEYIDGFVWANVWNTNRIIKIDPESGHVVGHFYLNNIALPDGRLASGAFSNTDVLNGIAYDSTTKSLLITGKRWPKLFEIRIN